MTAQPPIFSAVALCGDSGAGKSTAARILQARGFLLKSPTALLRAQAEAELENPDRAQVQAFGIDRQRQFGNAHFLLRILAEVPRVDPPGLIIDGLRNLDELYALRGWAAEQGLVSVLIGVQLDARRRFDRVCMRQRAGDPSDFAKFERDDARANGEDAAQDNAALIAAADHLLCNDSDEATLEQKLLAAVFATPRPVAGLRPRAGTAG